jgi:outer membrane protein assembly factor BamB
VIAGFASGKVAALTTANGFQVWESSIAIPQGRSELERLVDVDADPVVVGDTAYVVSFQGKIAIIDLRNGNLGWTREMSSYAGLGVDFSQVYVTDVDSKVWALSRDNGASVWKQEKLHNRALTAPEPFDSYVAVGDFEGYLHLLASFDGHIAARVKVDGKGIAARPQTVGDVLYVYGKGGKLAAYTLRGG